MKMLRTLGSMFIILMSVSFANAQHYNNPNNQNGHSDQHYSNNDHTSFIQPTNGYNKPHMNYGNTFGHPTNNHKSQNGNNQHSYANGYQRTRISYNVNTKPGYNQEKYCLKVN